MSERDLILLAFGRICIYGSHHALYNHFQHINGRCDSAQGLYKFYVYLIRMKNGLQGDVSEALKYILVFLNFDLKGSENRWEIKIAS